MCIRDRLSYVDADTRAFHSVMNAFGLPKSTDEEKTIRKQAIQEATKTAIVVPFNVMKTAFASMDVIKAMVENGNPNSVSDAGVGAICARGAVMGSFLNVKINAAGYDDKTYITELLQIGKDIENKAIAKEKEILELVNEKIGIL